MERMVREAAVQGMFYPATRDELSRMVNSFLNAAQPADIVPKALIVPHAGYVYSGPIAASAYRLLAPLEKRIQRVVLVGPPSEISACTRLCLPYSLLVPG